MTSPNEATIPASRLRKGYLLPAYGPQATISRPPIISPDGSMVSLVVTSPDEATPRLVRVPIDQPIEVVRHQIPANKFVRLSRTAKSSGARILVLDLAHPDSEVEPVGDQQFATLCTPHHSLRFYSSVSTAEAMCSHPEEWCTPCLRASREQAQHRVYGVRERKLA